jgi:hypothetical protein
MHQQTTSHHARVCATPQWRTHCIHAHSTATTPNATRLSQTSTALLSLGTFCDNGCQATFNNNKVSIQRNNVELLQGYRNKQGLWAIDLHTNTRAIHEPIPLPISDRHHNRTQSTAFSTHCLFQPSALHVDGCHQPRFLYYMARPLNGKHTKIATEIHSNRKRPSRPGTQESMQHQTGAVRNTRLPKQGCRTMTESCICHHQ